MHKMAYRSRMFRGVYYLLKAWWIWQRARKNKISTHRAFDEAGLMWFK